jgi:hypothetical protein
VRNIRSAAMWGALAVAALGSATEAAPAAKKTAVAATEPVATQPSTAGTSRFTALRQQAGCPVIRKRLWVDGGWMVRRVPVCP